MVVFKDEVIDTVVGIQEVADQFATKGMTVDAVHKLTGVISGSCPAAKKAALEAVTGVHSVEDDLDVHTLPDAGAQ